MRRPLSLLAALAVAASPATAAETYHFRLPNPAAQAAASATSKALLACMSGVQQHKSGPYGAAQAGGTTDTGCQSAEDGGAVYAPATPPKVPGIGGEFIGMDPPPGITGAFDRDGKPLPGKKPVATRPTAKVSDFPALAKVGDQVNATVTSAGILGTVVSVQDGTLPPGIVLDASTLRGQFTTAGSYAFTVRVSRGADPTVHADAKVSVTVSPRDGSDPAPSDPNGGLSASYPYVQSRLGDPVSAMPRVANAKGPLTYSLKAGSPIPSGFTLDASTGAIGGKGTVVTPGEMTDPAFYVTVSDGKGSFDAKVRYTTWVKVSDVQPGRVQDTQDFDLSTSTTLPGNGQTLTFTLAQATHLKGAILQTDGTLDLGLVGFQVSADGSNWQTLRANVDYAPVGGAGRYMFILNKSLDVGYVRFTNRSTSDYVVAQADFGVGSDGDGGGTAGTAKASVAVTGYPATAKVGDSVNASVVATGFKDPVVTVASGNVPPGITVSATTIAGTFTQAGPWTFVINARERDDATVSAVAAARVEVGDPAATSLSVTYDMLEGYEGDVVSMAPKVSNAKGALTYGFEDTGKVPKGVTLSPSSGALGGTAQQATSYGQVGYNYFNVVAGDGTGSSVAKVYYYWWLTLDSVSNGDVRVLQDRDSMTLLPIPAGKSMLVTLHRQSPIGRIQFQYGTFDASGLRIELSQDGQDWHELKEGVDYQLKPSVVNSLDYIVSYTVPARYMRVTDTTATDYSVGSFRVGP